MNTTLLFAELLIIGLEVGVWLFLLLLNIFGYRWVQALQLTDVKDWQTLIVVMLFSIFYVLGIMFDRLADYVFSGWDKRIRDKVIPDAPFSIAVIRFEVGKDNEYLNRLFEYTRSRMRIARASSLNLAITTVFAVTFILTQLQGINAGQRRGLVLFTSVTGICLTGMAIYAWHKLTRTYFGLVKSNYDLHTSKQSFGTEYLPQSETDQAST